MIDSIETALVAQNDTGAMAVVNELALYLVEGGGEETLDAALREVAAGRGGEAALGQAFKEALNGASSHGALALLDLLFDRLGIDPGKAARTGHACGCDGGIDSGGTEEDVALMSFSTTSDDGNWEDENGNGQWDEGETIYVDGEPLEVDDESDWVGFWGGGSLDDGGGGVGNGPDGGELIAEETPCVEAAPSGVSLQDLNNKVLEEANEIVVKGDWNKEWGAIFYISNGQFHSTGLFTSGDTGEIDWSIGIAMIPDDAVIVATLHSHPDIDGINDGIPSYTDIMAGMDGKDWIAFDQFINLNTRGITSDSNLLMYIVTNEDNKTRVYDNTDRNTQRKSCALTD